MFCLFSIVTTTINEGKKGFKQEIMTCFSLHNIILGNINNNNKR
jgi:hypothetical protein